MLIQAAREWEAADFRPDRMPTLEDIGRRNVLWRQQVVDVFRYIEWTRKAAEHPSIFGSLDEAIRDP